jgi:hypothetical protein
MSFSEKLRRCNQFLLGLFLLCMSTPMLQIIQTRILSVISMYYLAFLAIGTAMLGMTAGGLLTYYKLSKLTTKDVAITLSRLSTTYALTIAGCFLVQLAPPLPIVEGGTFILIWAKILFLLAAPFTIAGVAVSLALTRSPFPIGITYGVDLVWLWFSPSCSQHAPQFIWSTETSPGWAAPIFC